MRKMRLLLFGPRIWAVLPSEVYTNSLKVLAFRAISGAGGSDGASSRWAALADAFAVILESGAA